MLAVFAVVAITVAVAVVAAKMAIMAMKEAILDIIIRKISIIYLNNESNDNKINGMAKSN